MCCSVQESEMSDTQIYVGQAEKDGKTIHVLAYQNSAVTNKPNAMVIPFPTSVKMGQENVINTTAFKGFLKNISDASKIVYRSADKGFSTLNYSADSLAEVFDVGSYTVILAENVFQIPEALTRVDEKKRPSVTSDFLIGFGKLYPDQPIAVCCWDGSIESEPLLWWYEPTDTKTLFIPTMDAHNGKAPVVGTSVYVDHIISVGAVGPTKANKVYYENNIPEEAKTLLPTHVHGLKMSGRYYNNDSFVKTADLHSDEKLSYSPILTRDASIEVMNGWR